MGGIYIKGMEMPKDCLKCPFCLFADGYWKCLVDGSHADFGGTCRPSLCPLVPVPPHGRLVDADAAIANRDADMNWCYDLHDLPDYLSDCPTIIPASEEGE